MLRHGTELEQSKTVAASLLVVVPASPMYLTFEISTASSTS
eukprot:CAMPEP_0198225160 /NCGR_PEP_ID=MMETSP1445-20131203/99926_1 /TAXON_ID=36898 /ORGANISM="Pyramimonas sp., Strain CCMP2087" /LENGTH=40 /DNA_ID= /DNA_START= /DNA_END= /DNA_ORIENTATION=